MIFSALACPLDGTKLTMEDSVLRCGSGHSFDRAREGYYNLLASQHKSSAHPGDSKDMVQARTVTLNAGYYAPLADRLCTLTAELAETKPFRIIDAGCGEGYYLDRIARHLPPETECAGFDISKWMVRAASRRNPDVTWLVANNRYPPFMPGSIDLILCMFGFPVYDAFRTLQPMGHRLLMVDPGPDHLIELRRIIYPELKIASDSATADTHDYTLEREEPLSWTVTLGTAAAIDSLLRMTPHYFRMPQASRELIKTLENLTVTMNTMMRVLKC
jgi:23S rRNA (guanine745-N1)-methyltransferase